MNVIEDDIIMSDKKDVFVKAKLFQCSVCNGIIQMPKKYFSYSSLINQYKNATVTMNLDGGLSVYMEESWKRIMPIISPSPAVGRTAMKLQRLLLGFCERVVWKEESLRISPLLLATIGIPRDEAFIFILIFERKLEIWNPVDFNKIVTLKNNDINGELLFRGSASFPPNSYKTNLWPPVILE